MVERPKAVKAIRVPVGTVIWYGTDIPLTQRCEICGRVVYEDVLHVPVYRVYPLPVICSDVCNTEYLRWLTEGTPWTVE